MVRFRAFPIVLTAAAFAVFCVSLISQTASEQLTQTVYNGKPVPEPVEPKPFPTNGQIQNRELSIEFRPADQMTEQDKLLLANSESSIAEHAGFAGFELDQQKWNYQQIVCPALPNHLFLQYTRNNGEGDVTVFSASIPRDGEGRVRIVPILRRGYSLFSPAPINALTISAFNHIRAEEPSAGPSDWLGNGLCYAALAGAHPQIVSPDAAPGINKPIPALMAVLDVNLDAKNEEVIRFADASAIPRPMAWSMTFSRSGKLIKAKHSPAPMSTIVPVSEQPAAAKSWKVPDPTEN
jgi:hypothetical protein